MLHTKRWIRSFSRRSRLKLGGIDALEKYMISNDTQSIESVVSLYKRIWVEIGFGNGDNILHSALSNTDVLFIGCEPYLGGVSQLLPKLKGCDVKNTMIWTKDARDLIINFPDKIIERFLILFPDPWPKRSHNKRRLINKEFLELLADKTSNTGGILIKTDHVDYAKWIKSHVEQCGLFRYTNEHTHCVITKYHKKALEDNKEIKCFRLCLSG